MRATAVELLNTTVTGTIASAAQGLEQIYGFSIQAVVGSGITGTLVVQGSNDVVTTTTGVTNWTTLTGSSVTLSGAANVSLFSDPQCCYRWVRVLLTVSSIGAGTNTLVVDMWERGF